MRYYTSMKRLTPILTPILLSVAALYGETPTPPSPNTLSDLDVALMQKIGAQLQLLQVQFNQQAAPILKEQQDIAQRVCKAAHLEIADCLIDPDKKTVSKRPAQAMPQAMPVPTPLQKGDGK